MKPPATHLDLLQRPLFAHLATVRPDGAPQATPMWFLWDPDSQEIKLTHTKERYNYRNLQHEPRISAGVFRPDAGGSYTLVVGRPISGVKVVAVTSEPAPDGSAQPTEEPQLSARIA